MKFTLIFIFSILSLSLYAQKITKTSDELDWNTDRRPLLLSNNEAIFQVKFDKKEWGIVKVNSNAEEIWKVKSKDQIIGIGKSGENILVISIDDEILKEITGSIYEARTGKLIKQKAIFTNTTGFFQQAYCVRSKKNGSISKIFIRTSNYSGKSARFTSQSEYQKWLGVSKLQMMNIAEDLSNNLSDVKLSTLPKQIVNFTLNEKEETFILGLNEDNLVVFQIDVAGIEKQKLFIPISQQSNLPGLQTLVDENNSDKFFVAVHYQKGKDMINQLFLLDMATKKLISSQEEVLDKAYAKTLTMEESIGKKGDIKNIKDLDIRGIMQYGDNIVVIKEMITHIVTTGSTGTSSEIEFNGWVVSFYDKQLKNLKNIGANKHYLINNISGGSTIGMQKQGDKLYILAPINTGLLSYGAHFSILDMKTQQIEKVTNLWKDVKETGVLEAGATIWFDKSFLLEYMRDSPKTRKCHLQKVEL